ncbi:glycosyltransferase [Leptolyngbya sp. KIOST-1]|uniref:glycosyltransferase n=1 Tax=Leptolyngbya sp. KIOST-1 TaxID=1229172 RepID=UPI0018CEC10D|nr:glycosyltransferase [Leptolyngbya sp. KIOST-1]
MREFSHLLKSTGNQEYYGHKYILHHTAEIGRSIDEVVYLCCTSSVAYEEVIEPGLRAVGGSLDPYKDTDRLLKLLERLQPTHLVVHFPSKAAIQWAVRHQVKVIGVFADSFLGGGILTKLRHARLAKLLNHSGVDFIANHGLNSCRSLASIGVKPDKIVPWDFPYELNPADFSEKALGSTDIGNRNIVYVGAMTESKGVGNILEALARLKAENLTPKLTLIGRGDLSRFEAQVADLELGDQVNIVGGLPHSEVIEKMRWADIVVVPSWHDYPEGLPLTIYEALTVRTPLVISDHPMFLNHFELGKEVLMFPQKNAGALANCIKTLLTDAEAYATLSTHSLEAWSRLQLPVKWHDMLGQWVRNGEKGRQGLLQYSLGQYTYHQPRQGAERPRPGLTKL